MSTFTGHPLVDIGLATITAFANKTSPEELSEGDYDAIADYMAEKYVKDPLKSFLTVAFPNSGFTQSAFEKTWGWRHCLKSNRQLSSSCLNIKSSGHSFPIMP